MPAQSRSGLTHRPPPAVLAENNYGKSRVRMVKVSRTGKRHSMRELCVDIALMGDFDAVHTQGDNTLCLPTDTMKNTVYALGKDHPIESIESFGLHLARHFLSRNAQVTRVIISIAQVAWDRITLKGKPHPHCFTKGTSERQTCTITLDRERLTVQSGITDLVILKSTDSAFRGYPKDRYTTLPETDDRIFATSMTAAWTYSGSRAASTDFNGVRVAIRETLVSTFAAHKSASVQHTLYAMGASALAAAPAIGSIRLSMPNKHCLLVNLQPFGLTNANEIFVPTDEPHGLIEATITRR